MNIAFKTAGTSLLRACVLMSLLLCGGAAAQTTVRVGAGVGLAKSVVANVHAVVPFATFGAAPESVALSARADAAIVPGTVPAFGAALLLMGNHELPVQPYFGMGAGVSFPNSPLVTGYGLAGIHFQVSGRWGGFAEMQFRSSRLGSDLSLGVGASYTFGGMR